MRQQENWAETHKCQAIWWMTLRKNRSPLRIVWCARVCLCVLVNQNKCLFVREPAAAAIVPIRSLRSEWRHIWKKKNERNIAFSLSFIRRLNIFCMVFLKSCQWKIINISFACVARQSRVREKEEKKEKKKIDGDGGDGTTEYVFFFHFFSVSCRIKLEYQRDEWNRWKRPSKYSTFFVCVVRFFLFLSFVISSEIYFYWVADFISGVRGEKSRASERAHVFDVLERYTGWMYKNVCVCARAIMTMLLPLQPTHDIKICQPTDTPKKK